MSRWLCIEARFLAGRYHGRMMSAHGRDFPAEWPPNPHRLFQALVAAGNLGFRRTEFSDAKKAALRWLEQRDPPEIVAPPAEKTSLVRLYVPNNDMDTVARAWARGREPEKQPSELRTDKDLKPHRLDGDAAMRFLWPIGDAEWEGARPHAEMLCGEARHLHVLGLGIDLVAGNGRILTDVEKAALPGEAYIADPDGLGWPAPVLGSLDELMERHREGTRRVQAGRGRNAERFVAAPVPPSVWQEVGYRRRAEGRPRVVHAFTLVDEEGKARSFDPKDAMEVAAWLRHAAHETARSLGLDAAFTEGFVCGHGEGKAARNDRFSYLPLPTLSPKGRDGRIRRVLIAEPFGGGGRNAHAAARRLHGTPLVDEHTGEIRAELFASDTRDGVFRRYLPMKGAHTWGTVTPIVLPGRDDRRSRKSEALVLKALAQAGYATPVVEVALQREPVFPGQEMASGYRVPAYLKPFPRTHAVITFVEPVPGPIALGSGRHIGLGVMAALN